ncbi:hypothetical protein BCR36DRAFT_579084, partial [Piromyces finnis]
MLENGIPNDLLNDVRKDNKDIQTLVSEIKNQHEIWNALTNHLREQLIEAQETYNSYNKSIKEYFLKFEFLLNCYESDMKIIQELPASLINSKQISDAIPKEKIDLWKTRCHQEYFKISNVYEELNILYNNLNQSSNNEFSIPLIEELDYENEHLSNNTLINTKIEMMSTLIDKIKRIQTISNNKYIFDMDLVKLIKYMKTIDTHFNQLDYLHNIPIFWYATLLEIIRRKQYNNLIHLKFAVFKDQIYYQEKKRKNEYNRQFQQFFNLNYVSELDDKTSTFTPSIFNFCDNFPIKEYIQKNESLINQIILNYNHEEYKNHGTSLYPIIEKMKTYVQELEDAIEFENNMYKNNQNNNLSSPEYYENQIKELKLQNFQLNEKIQQIEHISDNEKKTLINEIEKLKNENLELSNTLGQEKEKIIKLENEKEKLNDENIQFKNEINQLKNEIDKLNLTIENHNKGNPNIVTSDDSMNISNELEDWISLCHYSIEQLIIYHKNVCKLLNQNIEEEPDSESCQDLFKYVQFISSTLENNHLKSFKFLKNKLDMLSLFDSKSSTSNKTEHEANKLKFNDFEINDLVLFSKTNDPNYYSMFSPFSDIPYFLKTSEHRNILNSTPYLLSYILSMELKKSDEKEIPLKKGQPYYLVKVKKY